jgi:nickel superoxide dismutase
MIRVLRAHAHCDIPCGIYDPLPAQIAAMTVLRMHQLIEQLPKPGPDASKEELDRYQNSLSRYVAIKEQHSELVKRELDILWHDYFKPEHLEKYPDLHNIFWNTIKLASKTKQEVNKEAAEELVRSVQRIAEIFWETKGVQTHRVPTHMPVGGECVLPAA